MTFWQALKATYGGSLAFLVACPLLALVPVVFELAQHVVEVHIGMYESIAAAKALAGDSSRMGFGFLKVVALTVPLYWIYRFLASRDAAFARSISGPAPRLFALFLVVQLTIEAIQLFVVPQSGWIGVASLVIGQAINCLLIAWGVAAALANGEVGPAASITIMGRRLPWTFVFTLVAVLPLMVPHYVLGFLAIGAGASLWPILVVDALLVAWLTAVIAASNFFAAMRAAAKQDVPLVPSTLPSAA